MPVLKRKTVLSAGGRIIPRRRYPRPMRFVGVGILLMIAIVFFLFKVIVK